MHYEKNNPEVLKDGQDYGISVEKLDGFFAKYAVHDVHHFLCVYYISLANRI